MGDEEAVTLAKQGGITFVGRIIDVGLGFLFLAVVTRIIDANVYGEFTLALSIIFLLQRFDLNLDSAIDYFLPEQISKDNYGQAKFTLYNTIALNILTVGTLIVVIYFSAPLIAAQFNTPGLSNTLRSLIIILPLLSLSKIFYKYFNVVKKTQFRIYAQNIARPLAKIISLVIFTTLGFELLSLSLSYFVAYLSAFIICLVLFFTYSKQLRSTSSSAISRTRIIRYTLPLVFAGVMWTIIGQIDYFVIGYFSTTSDVAHYRVGYQLASNLVIVSNIFNPVFKPMIAERQTVRSELQSIYRLATRWVSMMLLPLCIVFILSPEPYLAILFTEEYTVAALAVTILALGYLISSSVGPESMVITGLGYSKLTLLNTALMLGVNITLNVALVPRLGIIGAAVGTSVALTVRSILGVTEIYFLESIHPYSFAYTRIWIAGSVGVVAGFLAKAVSFSQHVTFFIVPSVIFSTYILSLILFNAFTKDDLIIASRLDNKIGYPILQRLISTN